MPCPCLHEGLNHGLKHCCQRGDVLWQTYTSSLPVWDKICLNKQENPKNHLLFLFPFPQKILFYDFSDPEPHLYPGGCSGRDNGQSSLPCTPFPTKKPVFPACLVGKESGSTFLLPLLIHGPLSPQKMGFTVCITFAKLS